MKTIVVISLLLINAGLSFGQVKEPEFTGHAIEFKTQTSLERLEPVLKAKLSASTYVVGIGKTSYTSSVPGAKSKARFTKSDTLKFVVNTINNTIDPTDIIAITKLDVNVKKDIRLANYKGEGTSFDFQNYVPYVAKKFGLSSYLIAIVNTEPGEYMIKVNTDGKALFFGID